MGSGLVQLFVRGCDEPAPLLWSVLMFEQWALEARHGTA
jgi:hypothetical protein